MSFSVKLVAVLEPKRILILESAKKTDALKVLIDCLATASEVKNYQELSEGIFHCEELMSTGIGLGIGVAHVQLSSIENPLNTTNLKAT